MTYADASFLVSLYLRDTNTAAAVAYVKGQRRPLALTALQRHELRNALRLAVFRTKTSPAPVPEAETHAALAQIDADLASGNLVSCPLPWSEAMSVAERLGATHTMNLGVRGMDLLNVAAAVATKSRIFLTFDSRQRAVAQAAGLKVLP
jgi:predicted nucleic acid-binding protein